MQSPLQRYRVILLHLSFWCVYLSFFLYQVTSFQRGPEVDWQRVLTVVTNQVTFAVLISYLNYFIFLPRFLSHKKVWKYLIEFAVPFAVIMFVRIYSERFLIDGFAHQEE